MEEHVIVDSSFSAIINAPLEKIDIPAGYFSLPDEEYQAYSPAHFAAGSTDEAVHKTCLACHQILKARDFVFNRYAP